MSYCDTCCYRIRCRLPTCNWNDLPDCENCIHAERCPLPSCDFRDYINTDSKKPYKIVNQYETTFRKG